MESKITENLMGNEAVTNELQPPAKHTSGPSVVLTIRPTDRRECYADNARRIVLKKETALEFIGWPDPEDPENSSEWKPWSSQVPLHFPKFAWERA